MHHAKERSTGLHHRNYIMLCWKLASRVVAGLVVAMILGEHCCCCCCCCHACDPDVRIKKPLAAGCLVRNSDSELLMVQSALDLKWTFPAGNVESWLEKPQEAAARETLEEADITVIVNEAACAVKSFTAFPLDIDSFTGYCCSENPAGQNPSSGNSPEIVEARFLDRDAVANFLDDELRFPDQRQLLLDVIDGNLC